MSETKSVTFVLSEKAHADLLELSKKGLCSMTEVLRTGVGLFRVALEAERAGNRLIVTSPEGDPLKEIVLP